MNSLAPIGTLDHRERRRARRRKVAGTSTMRLSAGQPLGVTVRNLSITGLSIETNIPLPIGSLVQIGIPGVGRLGAYVRQAQGEIHGCEFLTPLRQVDLEAAFATDTVVRGAFPTELLAPPSFPDTKTRKWPGAVCSAIIIGSASLLWAAIWTIL